MTFKHVYFSDAIRGKIGTDSGGACGLIHSTTQNNKRKTNHLNTLSAIISTINQFDVTTK